VSRGPRHLWKTGARGDHLVRLPWYPPLGSRTIRVRRVSTNIDPEFHKKNYLQYILVLNHSNQFFFVLSTASQLSLNSQRQVWLVMQWISDRSFLIHDGQKMNEKSEPAPPQHRIKKRNALNRKCLTAHAGNRFFVKNNLLLDSTALTSESSLFYRTMRQSKLPIPKQKWRRLSLFACT